MENTNKKGNRRWLRIAIVLCVFVLIYIVAAAAVGSMLSKKVEIEPGTILEIEISGVISEGPQERFLGELTGGTPLSLWDIRNALRAAASDPKIEGVRLLLQTSDIGWAASEELLQELDNFRSSKKPVYVLQQSDLMQDLDYFLATGGDKIWTSPETGVLINGLAAEVTFWRGTLEKLRIEPEIIMFKEYKSAGEPLKNREMSPYMREANTKLLQTIDGRFKERVVKTRNVTKEAVQELLNLGIATTDELKRRGFVDNLGYLDELETEFESLQGVIEYKGVGLYDYLSSLEPETEVKQSIAVLFGEGQIVAQDPDGILGDFGDFISGPTLAAHIRKAVDDESVKAIVLRVNSPGGSAVGSDIVTREIHRARGKGKPVVVSMSDVAGSGGYWISMHANQIVAHPTTITGSIGVISAKFNIIGFMDWIGANVDTITTAPYADLLGYKPFDEDRRARFVVWMDDVYNSFVGKVADGRKMNRDEVEKIARGRIWSGTDALGNGLIDKLGGMDEAIALAVEEAKLDATKEYPLVVYPRPKTLMEQLFDGSLFASTPKLPSQAKILKTATELARPKVLVKMQDVEIR